MLFRELLFNFCEEANKNFPEGFVLQFAFCATGNKFYLTGVERKNVKTVEVPVTEQALSTSIKSSRSYQTSVPLGGFVCSDVKYSKFRLGINKEVVSVLQVSTNQLVSGFVEIPDFQTLLLEGTQLVKKHPEYKMSFTSNYGDNPVSYLTFTKVIVREKKFKKTVAGIERELIEDFLI